MNETFRDIIYMAWSFIVGGICFILLGNYNNGILIGDIIYLDKAEKMINYGFLYFGIAFVILLSLTLLFRRIYRWNKNRK